ncbi:MAG: hypothetical protein J0H83_17565 [Candidatus Melainabacteria bacterium]|jgi:hypothetical protein|nr:hypothetical protein [Candidatus Melainabacteria bacterium]MBX9673677.1 protease inhibitor I42 family protein [Candidatus Obscuribacterales bacterium]
MLCPDCNQLSLSILKGTCAECGGDTVSDDHIYCDQCSLDQDACQVCGDELGIHAAQAAVATPGVFMVRKFMSDNGSTIKLKVGDELHLELDVSNGYTYHWVNERKNDRAVVDFQAAQPFVAAQGNNQNNWGKGTQTLVFKATGVGTTTLELKEDVNRSNFWGGGSGPSGVTWSATIQVK